MKVILFANTDWYLYNFRLELAQLLKQSGYEVILMSPDGEYRKRLEKDGFRWINLPLSRRGVNPFFELLDLFKIANIYRIEKPDIVHHFTIKCVLYGSTAVRLSGVKHVINSIEGLGYVFTAQGQRISLLRRFVLIWYRLILRGTRVIFLNQDDQAFFLSEKLIKPDAGILIPGAGVNIHRFLPEYNEQQSVPLVVLAGRMLFDKGVSEYVEAARILKGAGADARFALVGNIDSGNPAAINLETIEDWQKQGLIEWWGWRDHMEEVYHQASIICLPSYREGLPKLLIEAGACGLPLVTSDISGCRAVVDDGKNGLLVPPRDAVALANALRQLIEDGTLRQKMGEESRRLVAERFSTEIVNNRIKLLYQEAQNFE